MLVPMAKRINTSVPVSVVVIAKNSSATIEECLRSIMNNNPAEMIVVDGGSRDRTVRQAESLGAKVVYDGGKGPSTARNLGAELSASEFVAYVDSDVVIPPDALSTMLSEIKEAHASAVTSLVRF